MSTEIKVGTPVASLSTLLTVVFVTLKLCGVITWSWLWVLAPLWIGFAVGFVLVVITLAVIIIIALKS